MNERQQLSGGDYAEDGVCVCMCVCALSFMCVIKTKSGEAEGSRHHNTSVKKKVRERREKKRREGWYRTFLQTHVYHARLAQLQEEVLVFLILLIVNNFHVNYFAARGTITG